jgi:hypothetical protein
MAGIGELEAMFSGDFDSFGMGIGVDSQIWPP